MIFAIDPVELKRTLAPTFGATHTAPSVEEALRAHAAETWGRMCDKVICAMGVGQGSMMASILGLTAKRGRVVVTNIHPMAETDVTHEPDGPDDLWRSRSWAASSGRPTSTPTSPSC